MINLTIWNEFVHEQEDDHVRKLYPKGIHGCIKEFLEVDKDLNIKTATLEEPEHGLSQEVLNNTDVLIWWGHKAHNLVDDKIVDTVYDRITNGIRGLCFSTNPLTTPVSYTHLTSPTTPYV